MNLLIVLIYKLSDVYYTSSSSVKVLDYFFFFFFFGLFNFWLFFCKMKIKFMMFWSFLLYFKKFIHKIEFSFLSIKSIRINKLVTLILIEIQKVFILRDYLHSSTHDEIKFWWSISFFENYVSRHKQFDFDISSKRRLLIKILPIQKGKFSNNLIELIVHLNDISQTRTDSGK